jgi:hypothetical protein
MNFIIAPFALHNRNDKVILTSAMRRAPGFTVAKKSLSQLRLALLRVASQTTKAFSHCYTSLESLLKAKWQRIRPPTISTHVYEIRPRADKRGIDLISDVLPYSHCGMPGQTQSAMPSALPSLTAGHMML